MLDTPIALGNAWGQVCGSAAAKRVCANFFHGNLQVGVQRV